MNRYQDLFFFETVIHQTQMKYLISRVIEIVRITRGFLGGAFAKRLNPKFGEVYEAIYSDLDECFLFSALSVGMLFALH